MIGGDEATASKGGDVDGDAHVGAGAGPGSGEVIAEGGGARETGVTERGCLRSAKSPTVCHVWQRGQGKRAERSCAGSVNACPHAGQKTEREGGGCMRR